MGSLVNKFGVVGCSGRIRSKDVAQELGKYTAWEAAYGVVWRELALWKEFGQAVAKCQCGCERVRRASEQVSDVGKDGVLFDDARCFGQFGLV